MKRITGSILGIAVSEREFAIAEMSAAGVVKTSTWEQSPGMAMPGLSAEKVAAAGTALRKHLKDNGFSASKAILGLPAKWITARPWQVPPATPTAAASILRLVAERQFPPELKDFLFDYAGSTHPTQPSTVLLAGTSQQRMRLIVETAESAGLNVLAVTSSSLALSAAMKQPDREKILIAVSPESAELVVNSDTGPRLLRHLPIDSEQLNSSNGSAATAVASLGSELMRASVAAGEPTSKDILLWDSLGLRADAITTLRDRYGLSISAALLDMTDNADSSFGPAAALALLVLRGQSLPIDFLHSRLAAPKKHRIGRKAIWAAAIVVAILIGIAASIWSQQNQQRDLDDLNARLKQMQPDLTAARAMDAKVSAADGWYANRPSMLECLEHITAAFPQEGSIWATNISIRDNGLGTVTGRARDQNAVLTVYDHMKNDPKFSKATVDYIRQGTGSNAKQITFSISFSFSL